MRGILLSLTMAFALAMQFSETTLADPWYKVKHDATVPGTNLKGVALMSESHGRGFRRCVVPRNEEVHRDWGDNWSRWIYVKWRPSDKFIEGWSGMGGEGYCPDWNTHGWIDKEFLESSTGGIDPNAGLAANAEWYVTKQHTEIRSERSKNLSPKGGHKCTIPRGEHVRRDNNDRSGEPYWIYVRWKKTPILDEEVYYNGTWGPGVNNWCQDWNRHGWVYVGNLKPVRNPGW